MSLDLETIFFTATDDVLNSSGGGTVLCLATSQTESLGSEIGVWVLRILIVIGCVLLHRKYGPQPLGRRTWHHTFGTSVEKQQRTIRNWLVVLGGIFGFILMRNFFLNPVERIGFSMVLNNLGDLSSADASTILNSSTFWKLFMGLLVGAFAGGFSWQAYLKQKAFPSNFPVKLQASAPTSNSENDPSHMDIQSPLSPQQSSASPVEPEERKQIQRTGGMDFHKLSQFISLFGIIVMCIGAYQAFNNRPLPEPPPDNGNFKGWGDFLNKSLDSTKNGLGVAVLNTGRASARGEAYKVVGFGAVIIFVGFAIKRSAKSGSL